MKKTNETRIIADPASLDVLITREFEAPRDLVFEAYTKPELIVQWLGPRELVMKLEKFEPHNGGSYRYIHTDPTGTDHCFHGVVHEVADQERIIQTFEYEGLPEKGHVVLETTRFKELPGGRTLVTVQSVFQSHADKQGMIASGMEWGVRASHERLDELFARRLAKAS